MSVSRSTDLTGCRVVLTAQRRGEEFAAALERRGVEVVHAPTLSHIPHVDDLELLSRTRELLDGPPDVVIVTTGVGFRGWLEAADAAGLHARLLEALTGARIIARGPKAQGAVQREGLDVAWTATSETAREIKDLLAEEGVAGLRVAVQHHGAGSDGIDDALRAGGAQVVVVHDRDTGDVYTGDVAGVRLGAVPRRLPPRGTFRLFLGAVLGVGKDGQAACVAVALLVAGRVDAM